MALALPLLHALDALITVGCGHRTTYEALFADHCVEGPIVSTEAADIERDLRPLARRYLGKEAGDRYVEETRNLPTHTDNVLIRMRPERWLTTDYSKD